MRPTLQEAFEIIDEEKKLIINKEWFELYNKKINEYDVQGWYFALSKRYWAYVTLVKYIRQNHLADFRVPPVSSQSKTPVNPVIFLNSLGEPKPEYKYYIIQRICYTYIQYGIIEEAEYDSLLTQLYKDSFDMSATQYTHTSAFESDPPPESEYYTLRTFYIINKKLTDMALTILSLSRSGVEPTSKKHHKKISKFSFISNECHSKKSKEFALDIMKLVTEKTFCDYMRELSYYNERIRFISICIDIITGGILDVNHEIKEVTYGADEPCLYITDEFQHTLYELPFSKKYVLKTLHLPDVINSLSLHCKEEDLKVIKEKIEGGINKSLKVNSSHIKEDILGRKIYDKPYHTADKDSLLTAGWMKDFDSKNKERLASAWCDVILAWPNDVIIKHFSAWLKETKALYAPREFKETTMDEQKNNINESLKKIKKQKILQYLDIKILSAVLGDNLEFKDALNKDGGGEYHNIATVQASLNRNTTLNEIFNVDGDPSKLREFWFQS